MPRNLTNLALIDEIDNMSCITDIKVEDLTGEGNPQVKLFFFFLKHFFIKNRAYMYIKIQKTRTLQHLLYL